MLKYDNINFLIVLALCDTGASNSWLLLLKPTLDGKS